jgi:hypothetical protein
MDAKTIPVRRPRRSARPLRRHVVSRRVRHADGAAARHRLRHEFFDTLGIGSYATTTAVYKLRRLVPVKVIPGTLNVGHTLPVIAQAFIYTQTVRWSRPRWC